MHIPALHTSADCPVQATIDECLKSFKRVRQRPADFELDDALDEPGDGEHLRLTAVPAEQQMQTRMLSLPGKQASGGIELGAKSVPLSEMQGHSAAPVQKGRFDPRNWEQSDPEL